MSAFLVASAIVSGSKPSLVASSPLGEWAFWATTTVQPLSRRFCRERGLASRNPRRRSSCSSAGRGRRLCRNKSWRAWVCCGRKNSPPFGASNNWVVRNQGLTTLAIFFRRCCGRASHRLDHFAVGGALPLPRTMAMRPVRASSMMPKGRIISINASTLPSCPAISMITLSGATSTIRPRKFRPVREFRRGRRREIRP